MRTQGPTAGSGGEAAGLGCSESFDRFWQGQSLVAPWSNVRDQPRSVRRHPLRSDLGRSVICVVRPVLGASRSSGMLTLLATICTAKCAGEGILGRSSWKRWGRERRL